MTLIRSAHIPFLIIAMAQAQTITDARAKYEADLSANPHSSVIRFRLGEIYFHERNFQLAANTFRQALAGDLQPKWVEVWAHIRLGNIFDVTDQRERALNEYRLAAETNDNTRGAQDEIGIYLEHPYPRF